MFPPRGASQAGTHNSSNARLLAVGPGAPASRAANSTARSAFHKAAWPSLSAAPLAGPCPCACGTSLLRLPAAQETGGCAAAGSEAAAVVMAAAAGWELTSSEAAAGKAWVSQACRSWKVHARCSCWCSCCCNCKRCKSCCASGTAGGGTSGGSCAARGVPLGHAGALLGCGNGAPSSLLRTLSSATAVGTDAVPVPPPSGARWSCSADVYWREGDAAEAQPLVATHGCVGHTAQCCCCC